MTTFLFIIFLFGAVYLGQRYSKDEKKFFEAISKVDNDAISSHGINSENAFKAHIGRMKFFKKKVYKGLNDESINLMANELRTLNRVSGFVCTIGVLLGLYLFFR